MEKFIKMKKHMFAVDDYGHARAKEYNEQELN
jgi:hypothetical protein